MKRANWELIGIVLLVVLFWVIALWSPWLIIGAFAAILVAFALVSSGSKRAAGPTR